jgi:hypothetical protein
VKRKGVSKRLKNLGTLSREVGILLNEIGTQGKGVCNKLYSSYSRFVADVNDARTNGTDWSTKIMRRPRFRSSDPLEPLANVLFNWTIHMVNANSQVWNAIQIGKDLDREVYKQNDSRSLQDGEYSVSKGFGFFPSVIGGGNLDDFSHLARLIPKEAVATDLEALRVHVKMMERCRNLLEDTQGKVAMLYSMFTVLIADAPWSESGNSKGNLDWSSEDILERVRCQLQIIESQIEMSPWGELEKH